MYVCMYVCVCMHVCMYVCMYYVCMYVCMCQVVMPVYVYCLLCIIFACLFNRITTGRCNRIASRDGVVGIANRLPAGRSRFRIPVGAREFSLLQNVQPAVGPTQCPTQRVPAFFPVDRRPRHEVNH